MCLSIDNVRENVTAAAEQLWNFQNVYTYISCLLSLGFVSLHVIVFPQSALEESHSLQRFRVAAKRSLIIGIVGS